MLCTESDTEDSLALLLRVRLDLTAFCDSLWDVLRVLCEAGRSNGMASGKEAGAEWDATSSEVRYRSDMSDKGRCATRTGELPPPGGLSPV